MTFDNRKLSLISGDSWSVGEWHPCKHPTSEITHGGLSQYLHEEGQIVVNVGQGGSSNRESYLRIRNFFFNNHHLRSYPNKQVIVFKSEWTRDFAYMDPEDKDFYDQPMTLRDRINSRFYYDLSALAQEWDVTIKIIGGCSDTLLFDDFQNAYPGLEIICQSMVNLLVNNCATIENPVFSVFSTDPRAMDFLKLLKKHTTDVQAMEILLDEIDRGHQRSDIFGERKDLFYPDGTHPNREAHKILYDFLKRNNSI